jgi:hypothetical protein
VSRATRDHIRGHGDPRFADDATADRVREADFCRDLMRGMGLERQFADSRQARLADIARLLHRVIQPEFAAHIRHERPMRAQLLRDARRGRPRLQHGAHGLALLLRHELATIHRVWLFLTVSRKFSCQ